MIKKDALEELRNYTDIRRLQLLTGEYEDNDSLEALSDFNKATVNWIRENNKTGMHVNTNFWLLESERVLVKDKRVGDAKKKERFDYYKREAIEFFDRLLIRIDYENNSQGQHFE